MTYKVLITGSTPIQVGSSKTQLRIVTAAAAWKPALEDLGYEVDWRLVTPGEDLSDYDMGFVILNAPNKIGSAYVHGALWTLSQLRSVIILDDWQTKDLIRGIETCARSKERLFRLRNTELDDRIKTVIFEGIGELARMKWDTTVVAPILGVGDTSKLDIPAPVIPIDPTIYSYRYPREKVKREKVWVQASLLSKSLPELSWPVNEYCPQDRGLNGHGSPGVNAKPRLPEPELMKVYCGAWGVLSPAHPHAGSGWWRVRYLMAADAGCVLSADPREAACLGTPYIEASDPRRVEKLSLGGLEDLANRQSQRLKEITWSKDRVQSELKKIVGDTLMKLPPLTFTKSTTPRVKARSEPGLPSRNEGEGSGAYIRRLLALGASTEAILERIHAQFPGSKATASDVSYNKNKFKKDGAPVIVESRPPPKYTPPVTAVPSESPFAALRAKIDKGVTDATLAAMLHHTVNYLEGLK